MSGIVTAGPGAGVLMHVDSVITQTFVGNVGAAGIYIDMYTVPVGYAAIITCSVFAYNGGVAGNPYIWPYVRMGAVVGYYYATGTVISNNPYPVGSLLYLSAGQILGAYFGNPAAGSTYRVSIFGYLMRLT